MEGFRDESNALCVAFIGFRIYLDRPVFKLKYLCISKKMTTWIPPR